MGPKRGEPSNTEKNQKQKYEQWMLVMPHFTPYLEYKNSSTKTLNTLYKAVMNEIEITGTVKTFSKAFERGPLAWAKSFNTMQDNGSSGILY